MQRSTRRRAGKPPPTLLSVLGQCIDHRDLLLDTISLHFLAATRRELREWVWAILGERRVTEADVLAGKGAAVAGFAVQPDGLPRLRAAVRDLHPCQRRLPARLTLQRAKFACSGEWNEPGTERWHCTACAADCCFDCWPRDTTTGIALEDSTVRLAAGEFDLGEGKELRLLTDGLRLLGEDGVVITRAVDKKFAVITRAKGVVIEKVAIRPAGQRQRRRGRDAWIGVSEGL